MSLFRLGLYSNFIKISTLVDSLYRFFKTQESRTMNQQAQREIAKKLKVLNYTKEISSASQKLLKKK